MKRALVLILVTIAIVLLLSSINKGRIVKENEGFCPWAWCGEAPAQSDWLSAQQLIPGGDPGVTEPSQHFTYDPPPPQDPARAPPPPAHFVPPPAPMIHTHPEPHFHPAHGFKP